MRMKPAVRAGLWAWDWIVYRGALGRHPLFAEEIIVDGHSLGGALTVAQSRYAHFVAWRHVQAGRFVCRFLGHDWQSAHESRTGREFPMSSCARCWMVNEDAYRNLPRSSDAETQSRGLSGGSNE